MENGKSFCKSDKKKSNDKMASRCVCSDHERLELYLSHSNNQLERKNESFLTSQISNDKEMKANING